MEGVVKLKLYLVRRTDEWSWDDYDSFVCAAHSEEEARTLAPGGDCESKADIFRFGEDGYIDGWVSSPNYVSVKEIGISEKYTEPTIICASFNAG